VGGFNLSEKLSIENKIDEFRKESEVLDKISYQLEKAKFGDYIQLMQNPFRMVSLNFFSGMARGFGFAFGFTILGAIVLYFIQKLVLLNIPVIGGVVTEIVKLVKLNIR
jgi:hypothetical protein